MVIEVTFDVTDVYISTTVSPVYVNVSFEAPSGGGGAEWGDITGTLSDQTDLQTALDAKFDDPTGTSAQYIRGDGSLATFPSLTGYVPYTGATSDVNLGTHRITAQHATIASSGSGDTAAINHSSGSGIGLNITKGGNGEGLYINKTGGSGNAATIIGTINATTLVKSGGTSSQFLKADGTVDSSVYVPTSRELTINGVTYDLSANRSWTVSGGISGSGASGQVAYWTGTSAQSGSNNLFWDSANGRLGIGTNAPVGPLHINADITASTNGFLITRTGATLADANFQLTNATNNSNQFLPLFLLTSNFISSGVTFGGQFSARITNANPQDIGIVFEARTKSATALSQGYIASFRSFATDYVRIAHNGNMLLQNGGTFTDGGQRLQVQGTTLLNGNVTFSSATGMFWDATNNRLGIGTNAPAHKLDVFGSAASNPIFNVVNQFSTVSGDYLPLFECNGPNIQTGGTAYIALGRNRANNNQFSFGFVYAGNNSTSNRFDLNFFGTSPLLSVNAAGSVMMGSTTSSGERLQVTGTMKVTGNITGGFSTNALYNASNGNLSTNRVSNISNNSWLELFGAASISTTNSSIYLGSREGLSWNSTSGVRNVIETYNNINPTSGTAVTNIFSITGIIYQTGGANGITRGLYVNPTLTAAADFRAIETARGNVVFGNLPTSPVGLPTGAIWNNLGMINIV